jgi:hypothetical protein
MTPQLALEPTIAGHLGGPHLTEEQFGELLAQPAGPVNSAIVAAEAHLLTCEQCAAELTALRASLSLFREASTAHADNVLRRLPQITVPVRGIFSPALQRAYLATAAATVFLAALLPMQMLRQHAARSSAAVSASAPGSLAESDEALLDDVDRDASASVPSPMRALADPTAIPSSPGFDSSISSSDQRKD